MKQSTVQQAMSDFRLPEFREIPDVGLYLEQVVKYINGYFVKFPEMAVTSSMISNYVKSKMISSPHKKTYEKEQIAALIFIAASKTVLSMEHIRMCLNSRSVFETDGIAYDTFAQMMNEAVQAAGNDVTFSEANTSEEVVTLRNIIIAVSHKMYLERYFDLKKESTEIQ